MSQSIVTALANLARKAEEATKAHPYLNVWIDVRSEGIRIMMIRDAEGQLYDIKRIVPWVELDTTLIPAIVLEQAFEASLHQIMKY